MHISIEGLFIVICALICILVFLHKYIDDNDW